MWQNRIVLLPAKTRQGEHGHTPSWSGSRRLEKKSFRKGRILSIGGEADQEYVWEWGWSSRRWGGRRRRSSRELAFGWSTDALKDGSAKWRWQFKSWQIQTMTNAQINVNTQINTNTAFKGANSIHFLYPNALLVIGSGWHLWKCFSIISEKIKFLRQFLSRPEPCFACMAETVAVIPFPAKPLLLPAPTSSRPGTVGKNTLFLRTAEEREDKTGVGGKLEYRKALFLWNPQFLPLSSDNSRPEAGTTLVKRKVGKDGPKNVPFLAFATKGAPLSAPLKSDQWHKNAAQ